MPEWPIGGGDTAAGDDFGSSARSGIPKLLTFTMPAGLSDVGVGDLNGDGLPDVVIANN